MGSNASKDYPHPKVHVIILLLVGPQMHPSLGVLTTTIECMLSQALR